LYDKYESAITNKPTIIAASLISFLIAYPATAPKRNPPPAEATYQKQNKKYSTKQILETFVYPLLNQGYIDNANSDLDKRDKIYYPVISSSKNRNLFDLDQSNNFSQEKRVSVVNPSLYPNKEYLISKIRHVLKYSSEKEYYRVKKIVSYDNREISIEELVDTHYNNPENYFQAPTISDQKGVSDLYNITKTSNPLQSIPSIVPILLGLLGAGLIIYDLWIRKRKHGPATILAETNRVARHEPVPSLIYGRIIIRHRTENQHNGTYHNSEYLLEVVNSTPNTVARNCEAVFDLHNNTEISSFVGLWNRNTSPTISIGHPELLKLFTVSLFYIGNRRVDTKLHFYVRSNVEGALDYFDIPYGENMNRELRVLLQSTNANYPSAADAFNRTIQNIIDNAVEE